VELLKAKVEPLLTQVTVDNRWGVASFIQVRFELSTYALAPGLECIVPWRIPEFYNKSLAPPMSLRHCQP
jgi:hypothetical protein